MLLFEKARVVWHSLLPPHPLQTGTGRARPHSSGGACGQDAVSYGHLDCYRQNPPPPAEPEEFQTPPEDPRFPANMGPGEGPDKPSRRVIESPEDLRGENFERVLA